MASLNEPREALKKEEKKRITEAKFIYTPKIRDVAVLPNIFLSFECGAKQRCVTLIFKVVERGVYWSFLQATLITDIIPKSAKNVLLTSVKNQAMMRRLWFKTILRSPECISRDKLMAIIKATLHSITKHRLPYWQLLILYW